MFPGGLLDTKYVAEFHLRETSSFLEYLFRKWQRLAERQRRAQAAGGTSCLFSTPRHSVLKILLRRVVLWCSVLTLLGVPFHFLKKARAHRICSPCSPQGTLCAHPLGTPSAPCKYSMLTVLVLRAYP